MTPAEKRAATIARKKADTIRLQAIYAETKRIVATAHCPICTCGLVRNLAIGGWWQCEQYGSVGFRKDSSKPACSWQGFTQ